MSSHKNASQRAGRLTANKSSCTLIGGVIVIMIGLAGLAAVYLFRSNSLQSQAAAQPVQFPHIHGLGFSADGSVLYVPAHNGLLAFTYGQWQVPNLPVNDYMGYTTTNNGFYSSGHPGSESNLPNPLGLVKSDDGGQTLDVLAFEGESDFHLMGVGYENNAIYVLNSSPNSQLERGLFYSLDDGQTWEQSSGQGIDSNIFQIAVHATESDTVAIATETGLHLSNDYGNAFALNGAASPVSAVVFHPEAESLFFGYEGLYHYDLATDTLDTLTAPTLADGDTISYLAVNPRSGEIAIATFNKDIYLSQNNRQTWEQIAVRGFS